MKKLNKSWFLFPIFSLLFILIFKLIDQFKITYIFPLGFNNDLVGQMAKLFFLVKYGFGSIVPNWYHGFRLFLYYPPFWFYFTLPIQYLVNNVQVATYISMLILLILGFIFVFILGKLQKFSLLQRVLLFLFIFANPIAIGNFIRLGRIPELFSWVLLIPIFALILHLKRKSFNLKISLLFIFLYILLILTHPTVLIISSTLLISLFLIKKNLKGRAYIIICLLIAIAITSFWLFPFVFGSSNLNLQEREPPLYQLITFNKHLLFDNLASFIIPPIFWFIFYLYWKSKFKSRKELIFYCPQLILSILYFTRLLVFVPIFNKLYPDVYHIFFILISSYLLFKINLKRIKPIFKKLILFGLILIPISSLFISFLFITPFIHHTESGEETINLFEKVDGQLLIISSNESASYALYSYAAIYHNIYSPSGWNPIVVPNEYLNKIHALDNYMTDKDCNKLTKGIKELNATNIISYYENCDTLKKCGFTRITNLKYACLYKT